MVARIVRRRRPASCVTWANSLFPVFRLGRDRQLQHRRMRHCQLPYRLNRLIALDLDAPQRKRQVRKLLRPAPGKSLSADERCRFEGVLRLSSRRSVYVRTVCAGPAEPVGRTCAAGPAAFAVLPALALSACAGRSCSASCCRHLWCVMSPDSTWVLLACPRPGVSADTVLEAGAAMLSVFAGA